MGTPAAGTEDEVGGAELEIGAALEAGGGVVVWEVAEVSVGVGLGVGVVSVVSVGVGVGVVSVVSVGVGVVSVGVGVVSVGGGVVVVVWEPPSE
jgi:hypothetical protein